MSTTNARPVSFCALALILACAAPDAVNPTELLAQSGTMRGARPSAARPTIVLVHGAFADASGWESVISLLQQDGFKVVAVQNTLSSIADDVASTRRLIDAQTGPLVVVAHSYGGAVISSAATGRPNVKALVYIAAFAPDANEPVAPLLEKYPSDALAKLVPDAAGFFYIEPASYPDLFAPDLPRRRAEAMAVAQRPLSKVTFEETFPAAAWRTIPSWFMVAQEDRIINPDLERFFAKRMGATTIEIKSSHAALLSHPTAVAKLIREAAAAP